MKSSKHKELISALEQELHRLSPDLSFSKTNIDPYTQLLYIVKVSIDTLLEEKASIKSEITKLNREHSPRSCQSEPADVNKTSSKLIDAQKELKKFERLLRQKEKKIHEQESELKKFSLSLNEQEQKLKEDLKIFQAKSIEQEKRLRELIRRENILREQQDKLNTIKLEDNKNANTINGSKFQRCYSERTGNGQEDSLSLYLKKCTLKIEEDKKQLDTKEKQLLEKQNKLESLEAELKLKIQECEKEKIKYINSTEPKQQRTEFSTEKSSFVNKKNLFDPKSFIVSIYKELEQNLDVLEGVGPLTKLKEVFELIIDEINEKEKILDDRTKKLLREEEKMLNKSKEFYTVTEQFDRLKNEIRDFNKSLKKDIEFMFSRVKLQSEEFSKNLKEVESLRKQLAQSIFLSPDDT